MYETKVRVRMSLTENRLCRFSVAYTSYIHNLSLAVEAKVKCQNERNKITIHKDNDLEQALRFIK